LALSEGNGCGFIAGALTEVGFGVVSSSMPALNHLIIKVLPLILESLGSTVIGSWFSSGSGNTKSFKESFQGRIGKSYRNKNFLETATVELSRHSDEPAFYNERDLASPTYLSRNALTGVNHVGEPYDDAVRSPSWLGGQFGREDLESNSQGMSNYLDSSI